MWSDGELRIVVQLLLGQTVYGSPWKQLLLRQTVYIRQSFELAGTYSPNGDHTFANQIVKLIFGVGITVRQTIKPHTMYEV